MALPSSITTNEVGGASASAPLRAVRISLVGDDAYTAGGSTGFSAYLSNQLGETVSSVLAVVDQSVGANELVYDYATDALLSFVKATGAQRANGNDSGTNYSALVVFQ